MHKDELKGKWIAVEGQVQEKIGDVTGNPEQKEAGLDKQIKGELQQVQGKIKNVLHKVID